MIVPSVEEICLELAMFANNICGFCGSQVTNSGRFRSDGIELLSCAACGSSRVEVIPTDLDNLYKNDYFKSQLNPQIGYADYDKSNLGKLLWVKQLIDLILANPPKSVLDIGCADGSLLSLFGPEVSKFGIEPNIEMADLVKKRDIEILGHYIESTYSSHKFDSVIGISLLEHLVDPYIAMTKIVELLETNGVFVLDIPCDSGESNDVWLSTSLEHLWHPKFDSISSLLSRVGCSWFSVHEIDIAAFGKTCIAFGGVGDTPKNLHRVKQLMASHEDMELSDNEKRFVFFQNVLYRNSDTKLFAHFQGIDLDPIEQKATIALLLERIKSFDKLKEDYESVVEAKEYHIKRSEYWRSLYSGSNLGGIGLVVPTLGERPDLLLKSLMSIKDNGVTNVCLVTTDIEIGKQMLELGLISQFSIDENRGLPAAINLGIRSLPSSVEFVSWLGDDDILNFGSSQHALEQICLDDQIVLVYGSCNYIDLDGHQVWKNKSGRWASRILKFGPCLIPQPGSLVRRNAFNDVGLLNEQLGWAFDLDLFIKLSKNGRLKYTDQTLASFRWHQTSLSVAQRRKSVNEASAVRKSYLHPVVRSISELWELPCRNVTFWGSKIIRHPLPTNHQPQNRGNNAVSLRD